MQTQLRSKAKRILIVDDDPDLLDILTEYLNNEGMEVQTSAYPDDIFKLIKGYKPDIILLDYILNGINGGEICHQVKSSVQDCDIPIAIISAYPRVLLSLGTYGCDLFIAKPFDLLKLKSQINYLLLKNPLNRYSDNIRYHLSDIN